MNEKLPTFRNSHSQRFSKIGALILFAKITEMHLFQSISVNKVASMRSSNLLKKRLRHRCFPVNFLKLRRTQFLQPQTYEGSK